MNRPTSRFLGSLTLLAFIGTGMFAQGLDRSEKARVTQKIEHTTPGFVPMLSSEYDENVHSLPVMSDGKDRVGTFTVPGMPAKSAEELNVPVIYASLTGTYSGAGVQHTKGMYKIADGVFTQLNSGTSGTSANGAGAKVGENYYSIRTSGATVYVDRFPVSTWKRAAANSTTNQGLRASDVAYDPTSDIVYGCFYNDTADGYLFGKVDYATRVRTAIKPLNGAWNAVMADAKGQIYAIDMNGDLLRVDKTTGDTEKIGFTGVVPAYTTSGTIDLATGRCFWNAKPSTGVSSLYEVNLTTGLATRLYDMPCNDELRGMYVEDAPIAQAAPAAAQAFEADFANGSFSGTLSFKAPATNNDGSAGSGNVTYKIWSNGVIAFTGEVAYNEQKSLTYSVEESDKYYLVIAFENEAGQGPITRVAQFIGNDTPKAPAPTLSRDGENFIISWDKVTASVNNGYINPDELTYTIRRYPDDIQVAENVSALSYSDYVPETYGQMIPYKYTVSATFAGNTGATGTTNLYPLGTIVPPYYEGFDDANSMYNFIVADDNKDGVTWIFSGGMQSAYINYSSVDHDDWLYTAAIYLTAGKTYTLNYEEMASSAPERLEVKMGKAPNAESMTTTLVESHELDPDYVLHTQVKEFTVEESGIYHIGFHALSDALSFFLYVDNISILCDTDPSEGSIEPPYTQTFDKSSVLASFTVIDNNHDGRLWNITEGQARVGYGENQPMDDWLITPAFSLKKDGQYNLMLDAKSRGGSTEKFEIMLGTSNTIESMTQTLIPVTTISSEEYKHFEEMFEVEEDGVYFVGIHGCSDPWEYELYIDNFKIAAPVFKGAPDAATDGHAEGADYGELRANVSFKAPTKTVGGDALTGNIDRIEATYKDELVATFHNVTPGQELSFTGTVDEIGEHTWVVTGYNSIGAGKPYEISGYVGVGLPSNPTDVTIEEEGNTGKVTLRWKAPATDVNGHALNPDAVTYIVGEVINGQTLMIAQNITETSYTLQAAGADTQAFKTYAIFAKTEKGNGAGMTSPTVVVGKPDTTPWVESAPNGVPTKLIGTLTMYPQAQWQLANDGYIDMYSADSDNGYFFMQAGNVNAMAGINSGKIDLSGLDEPVFSFYTYNIVDGTMPDLNELTLWVANPNEEFKAIANYVINDACEKEGWNKISVDLSAFKGQTIQFVLAGTAKNFTYIFVDNMSFEEGPVYSAEDLPKVTNLNGVLTEDHKGVLLTWDAPDTNAVKGIEHTGYKVYREDAHIGDATATLHADLNANLEADTPVTYSVTAIYKQGESLAESITLSYSGVELVGLDNLQVLTTEGAIKVLGAEGANVSIVSIDGVTYYDGKAANELIVNVNAGIYIVNVNGVTFKLNVR